eukprot:UN16903
MSMSSTSMVISLAIIVRSGWRRKSLSAKSVISSIFWINIFNHKVFISDHHPRAREGNRFRQAICSLFCNFLFLVCAGLSHR